jgi:hypothetical protein
MPQVDPEVRAAAYKTVDVFSAIVGRRLYVREGVAQRITDYVIMVPYDDECFYERVEHGISHILFGSNALGRDTFVFQYVDAIVKQAKEQAGVNVSATTLRDGIKYILGVLEAERVTSLWGQLYRGSEVLIRRFRHDETKHLMETAAKNVLHYITLIATDHDVKRHGEIAWMEPVVRAALKRVQFGTFKSTLLTTKWLVLQLVDHLVSLAKSEANNGEDATVDERAAALEQMSQAMSSPPASQKDKVNDFVESKYKPPGAEERAHDEAIEVINAEVENDAVMGEEMTRERDKMSAYVEDIRQKVVQRATQVESDLKKDVKAKVLFIDLKASDMDETQGYALTVEDQNTISRMRAFFFQVMGRRKQILEDTGVEPDIPAVIHRRLSHRAEPVFRAEKPGRGFKAMLLLDRSGSMLAEKTMQCDRGRKVLQRALKFPFVEIVTWGFNATDGTISLARFDNEVQSLYAKGNLAPIAGGTPLHLAIQVARQYLERGNEKKHIFVLTDGAPIFWRFDGEPITSSALRRFVRREIDAARRKGIGVTTLIIQDEFGLPEGLTVNNLHQMLGPANTWRILPQDGSFGADLSKVVMGNFLEYLRHG